MVDAMRRAEPVRAFLVLSLLLLIVGSMSGQSADCNYIRVVEPLAGSVVEPSTDAELSRVGITYFDGLGREVQQVAVGQGGDGEDIVTLTEYDRYGNAYRDWLTTPDPLAEQYPDLSPYSHCANNPLTIVDPDGRVLRDADGNIVYNTNKTEETWKFNYEKEDGSNGTINVKVEIGYIYANDGTPIQVLHNNTSSDARWDTNCHGVTFADEKYWLNTDVTKLIELEYTEIPISEVQKGDVVVYDVDNMPACHSATVHEVVAPDENMIDVYSQNSYEIDSTVKELFIDKRGTDSYRFFRGTGDRRITEEEINQLPIPK